MMTAVERVLILRGADLLKDLGPRHLLRLAEVVREIEIDAGDTLYVESDAADALYLVVEGRVRLAERGRTMSEVGPGEAFGTWALVDDSERGHRAECAENGVVLALPRSEFYEVAAGDLAILQELVRVLAKRLRALAADRPPEQSRVEGEGIEKPEAVAEAEAATGEAASAGSTLEAAVLGQAAPASGDNVAPAVTPAITDTEIIAPEPVVPVAAEPDEEEIPP
jgi:signal-transduction protein with cAMP-binding, CBS, and nucleotidyltransferase domain